ncbi:threonine ammonia-lyase [soil metagenome]
MVTTVRYLMTPTTRSALRIAGSVPGPDLEAIEQAALRIAPYLVDTTLVLSRWLSDLCGTEVYLKLENRQTTGSFKLRGALNAVAALSPEERAAGVVTASAGNHGAGVAHACSIFGTPAIIFVPAAAPVSKRERIAASGADLRLVDGGYDEAHELALEHAASTGAIYLHAFSDAQVVAGQGTVGLEIISALPDVATLLVPVGGGGLIGGIGVAARALAPAARIVGVQTPETSAMHDSLAAGRVVAAPTAPTLCDGLAGDIDQPSFQLGREVIDQMILVDEVEVRRAVSLLHRWEAITVEGSGAVAVAVLLGSAARRFAGPIAVVVTGGNIDAPDLERLLRDDR